MNTTVTPRRQSDLMSRDEAAQYLGVSSKTLATWACTKRYPLPVVKLGRAVKYRVADLEKFIASRTVGTPE
ncbi:MAG: helix-turn-helix domain-containing protein [Thiobacillus sp.]|nr:helix-turn-helix domain-containing protein [Thiobacillus sp.]